MKGRFSEEGLKTLKDYERLLKNSLPLNDDYRIDYSEYKEYHGLEDYRKDYGFTEDEIRTIEDIMRVTEVIVIDLKEKKFIIRV